jgi:WD40 repeat protein
MKSPFKFLDSYTKIDREIFFGREREIEELYHRVFESRIMLVYGVSGTGKSSLIHCGLANKFQESDWLPVNIRRGGDMIKSMDHALHRVAVTQISSDIQTPIQFKRAIRSLYLDYYKPIFFIFDQFEELFIFGNKKEKDAFIQIIKILVESDIQCRFIFVIREEYLAGISEFEKSITTFLSNRVRIERMSLVNANIVIESQCKINNIQVEEGFSNALLEKLSPGSTEVELTYLQVFLDKMYRLSTGDNPEIKPVFNLELLNQIGNVTNLLGDFLDEQISLLRDPDTALVVLKSFVSVKGTKQQMTPEEITEYAQTIGKKVDQAGLQEILQSFIHLRILSDKNQNGRYELKHDALAAKVYEKITLIEKDILEIRQFIDNAYQSWKKRGVLIPSSDLEYIAPYRSKLYLPKEYELLIEKSQTVLIKAKKRRKNIIIAATIFLLIFFAGFTGWALLESNKSKKQEIIAKANYFYATSRELVKNDPTKALRLADYAYKLNPGQNNFQNLVTIYSGNEFYFNIFSDKRYLRPEFKIKDRGIIAIKFQQQIDSENQEVELFDASGKILQKLDLLYNFYYWDITSDLKNILTISPDDTLRIYGDSGNLKLQKALDLDPWGVRIMNDSKHFYIWNRDEFSFYTLTGELVFKVDLKNENIADPYLLDPITSDCIYVLSQNGVLYKFSLTGKLIKKVIIHLYENEIIYTANLLDEDKIILYTSDYRLIISSVNGEIMRLFPIQQGYISYIKQLQGRKFFLTCDNESIKIWDYNGNNIKSLLLTNSDYAAYDTLNNRIIFVTQDKFHAWYLDDLGNNSIFKKEIGHHNKLRQENIIDYWGDSIKIFDINGTLIHNLRIPSKNDFRMFPSGNYILISNNDLANPEVKIINTRGESLYELKNFEYPYFRSAISKNDSLIVTTNGSLRTTFNLWGIRGVYLKTLGSVDNGITCLKISDDNKKIAAGSRTGEVILWDTSGIQLKNFYGHSNVITSLDFSNDGNFILSGSYDGTVKLWNDEGQLLFTFTTPEKNVWVQGSFVPGEHLFYITDEKNLRLFNVNGILLQAFPYIGDIGNVGFSKNKKFLYLTDETGIRKITIKESLDSLLTTNKFADLTIEEKLDYDYLQYSDIIKSYDQDQLFDAANYYIDKSFKVTDSNEKDDLLVKAEKLLTKGTQMDSTSIRFFTRLNYLFIQRAIFFNENIKDKAEMVYTQLLGQNTYEKLFKAGNYYELQTNKMTTRYGYPNKSLSIFKKIMKLYPSRQKNLSSDLGSLAWYMVYQNLYTDALNACLSAIECDPEGFFGNINLPPCYLLCDSVDKAKKLYLEFKDKPFPKAQVTNNEITYGDGFKSDLRDLKNRGIKIKNYDEIMELLNDNSKR